MSDIDRSRGLYNKYTVTRLHDGSGKHRECDFFVLDITHDPYALIALAAYAEACRPTHPLLAADLGHEIALEHARRDWQVARDYGEPV
jgi:hypothetical protein